MTGWVRTRTSSVHEPQLGDPESGIEPVEQ